MAVRIERLAAEYDALDLAFCRRCDMTNVKYETVFYLNSLYKKERDYLRFRTSDLGENRVERDHERAATHRFGSLLRSHRLAAGLTQAGLAQRAGVSTRGIQDIERGITHPYRTTAELLILALGLTEDERK